MRELNDLMEMEHVIRVEDDGTITENVPGVYAPESVINADWDRYGDAHVLNEHRKEFREGMKRAGWEMVRPRRAFGTYGDGFMDSAEYIGGFLEEDLRETPGVYVAVVIGVLAQEDDDRYDNEDPEPYGWTVLRKVDN